MIEVSIGLFISSFIAGFFTFFAPCTLPLIPPFLSIISGVKPESQYRWRIFYNAIFYVLGFSLVFMTFGLAFSFITSLIQARGVIQVIGGFFVILFGLYNLNLIKLDFLSFSSSSLRLGSFLSVGPLNSFILGSVFALGWSPCIGPILGSILFLSSNSQSIIQGGLLLGTFSIGLGLPFLITALFISRATDYFSGHEGLFKFINRLGGVFIVFLGLLLVTDKFDIFFGKVISLFFEFSGYEGFINKFM